MWEQILRRQWHVTTAKNGEVALQKIKQDFFNVVVTDIEMPVMDGISFLHHALNHNGSLRESFIIYTGDITAPIASLAQEYGIPVLKKPVKIQEMRAAVQRVITNAK